MYNNSEFCYFSSIVIKIRLPLDYSLDKEQTSYDKLITSLRTEYAEELNLMKDIGSYSDLLDALRLGLKGYHF